MDEFKKHLLEGIQQIETTKTHMTAMANAFDGSRIVSQAGAVMAQIQAIGGVTNMTAQEQMRANRILDEALLKYHAMGKEAPAGMQELASATRRAADQAENTSIKVGGLKGELMKFDGILSSMGINLSGPIRAIGELGDMAGKTVGQVGMIGTAGAALGAGYAGWQVGRMIADFFGLDEAIGNATAKLMGWGDLAGEEAAAGAEALNGQLSYQANLLRQAEQAGEANNVVLSQAALEWNFAAGAVEEAVYEYTVYGDVVNGVIQSTGELIAADEAWRSGLVFTTEVIGEQADSLDVLAEKKKADAAASKEAAEASAEAMKVFTQAFTSDLAPLSSTTLEGLRGNPAARGSDNGESKIRAKLAELEAAASRGPRGLYEGVVTREQYSAAQAQSVLLAQLRQYFANNSFADGVTNYGGGMAVVGERGPELVNLPRGSSVTPNHALGGVTIQPGAIQIMFPVMNDPRAMNELVNMLGEAFMQRLRMNGLAAPSGA